jgi:hypothetical protein
MLSYTFKQTIGTPPAGPRASLSGRCLSHTVLKGAIKRQWRIASAISRERIVYKTASVAVNRLPARARYWPPCTAINYSSLLTTTAIFYQAREERRVEEPITRLCPKDRLTGTRSLARAPPVLIRPDNVFNASTPLFN